MCVYYSHEGKYELIVFSFLCSLLHQVSSDMLTQCHFNYMEESVPVALEELGSELKQDWRGYLYACTTALLKEAREKYVNPTSLRRNFNKLIKTINSLFSANNFLIEFRYFSSSNSPF